jgi:hypothetical protein
MQRLPGEARLGYTSKRVTATWREEPGTTGPYSNTAQLGLSRPSRLTVSATPYHHHRQRGTCSKGRRGSISFTARSTSSPPRHARPALLPGPQEVQRARPSPHSTGRGGPSAPFVRLPHEEPLGQPCRNSSGRSARGSPRSFSAQRGREPLRVGAANGSRAAPNAPLYRPGQTPPARRPGLPLRQMARARKYQC